MTERIAATANDVDRSSAAGTSPLRMAVVDTDSGFLQVLGKRLERLGVGAPRPRKRGPGRRRRRDATQRDRHRPRRPRAPGVGIPREAVRRAAGTRRRRLHRSVDGRPARPRPAARRRRLADQAVPPRGADRPRRGRRAPPPPGRGAAERRARSWPARSRSARTASRPSSGDRSVDLTRREFELIELLAGAEGRVLEREEIYQRVWGYAMARGDRSVDVFVRKLRQKLEKAVAGLALHPHAFRRRLPLRAGAGRGDRRRQ